MLKFQWRKDDLRRRFYPPDFPGMYQRFQEVIREHVVAGARVLDAGCGSGRIFRYDLGPVEAQIVGVDITPQLRENPNIHRPLLGDVRALPFRDASFDVVLTSHVVEHPPRPAEAFREMGRGVTARPRSPAGRERSRSCGSTHDRSSGRWPFPRC